MAIDGFSFTTIATSRVDPDSPVDTTLMTDLRDNIEFLMRWLGRDFLANAVANHSHDGIDSAKVAGTGGTNIAIASLRCPVTNTTPFLAGVCDFTPTAMFYGTDEAAEIFGRVFTDSSPAVAWNGAGHGSFIATADVFRRGGINANFSSAFSPFDTAGERINIVFFKDSAGLIATGTYTGTGVSNPRTGLGFAPDLVIVSRLAGGNIAVCRTSSHTGTNSREFNGPLATNEITSLDANGFTVGTGTSSNTNLVVYGFIAFKVGAIGAEQAKFVNHAGTGAAKDLTGYGFAPQMSMSIPTNTATSRAPVLHWQSMADDSRQATLTTNLVGTGIIGTLDDGLRIASGVNVNNVGEDYDVWSWKGGLSHNS